MPVLTFLRRTIYRFFGQPPTPTQSLQDTERQQIAAAIQKERAQHDNRIAELRRGASASAYAPQKRLSPLGRSIVPAGRRMPPGEPPPLPTGFSPDDLGDWHMVSSSWIAALRFVPLTPVVDPDDGTIKNPRGLVGFVDMRVHDSRYPIYRYGPGVKWGEFDKWIAAASKGKFWWRIWTAKWSPAKKI